jgi:hypothetical protein
VIIFMLIILGIFWLENPILKIIHCNSVWWPLCSLPQKQSSVFYLCSPWSLTPKQSSFYYLCSLWSHADSLNLPYLLSQWLCFHDSFKWVWCQFVFPLLGPCRACYLVFSLLVKGLFAPPLFGFSKSHGYFGKVY